MEDVDTFSAHVLLAVNDWPEKCRKAVVWSIKIKQHRLREADIKILRVWGGGGGQLTKWNELLL